MIASSRGNKIVGLLFGVGFGFWLSWTRFVDYDQIVGALLFQRFYLWFMFATAVASGVLFFRVLKLSRARTLLDGVAVAWEVRPPARAHILGSVLFGAGWAVAGTCPGPAIAQVGRGQLSGLFTLAGIFVGVALAGFVQRRRFEAQNAPEPCTGEVQEGASA